MTEERKQELRQLLQIATAQENLETRPYYGFNGLSITLDQYKWHLRESWRSYSKNSLWIVNHFTLDISESIKSKLLDFMREELDSFIHEDKILSATFYLSGGDRHGTRLEDFLGQFLKIAIVQGIEKAVFNFEKCTEETQGSFQTIVLLEGIELEAEIQVFEGIHLIPLPSLVSEFPTHFGWNISAKTPYNFIGKTLLVIDYIIFPIFHKPSSLAKAPGEPDSYVFILPGIGSPVPTHVPVEWAKQRARFKVEVDGSKFPDFKEADFTNNFYQALSLACNSAVQFSMRWKFIVPHELFYAGFSPSTSFAQGAFGDSIQVGEAQIDKAKNLYEVLVNPVSNIGTKLQIPIKRWIKSKASKDSVDKMIDLGIALEALYLSEGTREQLMLQFRLRASWHLGKDKEHRKRLMDEFKAIYDLRSQAVHNGAVPEKIKIRKGEEPIAISEFIPRAQDLCRDSIIKILEDGEFPDWSNLILG